MLEAATGSISGQVSVPTGTSLANWYIAIDTNHNNVADDPVHGVTAADGTYNISDLPKGTYRVLFEAPDGYAVNAPAAGYTDVTLASDSSAVTGVNFSIVVTASGSISGTVHSLGGPLGGVTVFIDANYSGLPAGQVQTRAAADGSYSFGSLVAGTYRIEVVVPSQSQLTDPSDRVRRRFADHKYKRRHRDRFHDHTEPARFDLGQGRSGRWHGRRQRDRLHRRKRERYPRRSLRNNHDERRHLQLPGRASRNLFGCRIRGSRTRIGHPRSVPERHASREHERARQREFHRREWLDVG